MLNKLVMNNLYSFGSPIEFSLVAGRKTSKHPDHVVVVNGVKTLRGAIVYGPNAAGKSNLVKGVDLFVEMMSANSCAVSAGNQFCLDTKRKQGMSWILEYSYGGYIFRYSIGTDGKVVLSEKLELLSRRSDELLFERFRNAPLNLGPRLKCEPWYGQRYCTPDAFYLRKLELDAVRELDKAVSGREIIVAALDGLRSVHVVKIHSALNPDWFVRLINTDEYRRFLLELMRESDVGISDMTWQKLSPARQRLIVSETRSSPNPIQIVRRGDTFFAIITQNGRQEVFEFRFKHGTVALRADAESEGTIRLLHYSAFLYSLKQEESIWFVDEMDCHMHPFLMQFLLGKFFALKDSRSQLVLTAHDTNLMTQKLWRTDEVWLVQKRMDGSSNLYSLYQFTPRADKNLADGYIKGIYGALPCIGGEMIHA